MLCIAIAGTGYYSSPTTEFTCDLILEACVLLFARIDLYATALANVTRRKLGGAMARRYRIVNSQMTISGQSAFPELQVLETRFGDLTLIEIFLLRGELGRNEACFQYL
jgi:hypothetical protein